MISIPFPISSLPGLRSSVPIQPGRGSVTIDRIYHRGLSYVQRVKWLVGFAAKNGQLEILQYLAALPSIRDIIKEGQGSLDTYEMICSAVQGGSLKCVSVLLELDSNLV